MPLQNSSVSKTDYDVIIVGGGLAGLTAAIILSRNNKRVLLIEKKTYPYHKVCGEYISNEVLPLLKSIGFNPFEYGASTIQQLRISTPSGRNIFSKLDLGGFGLSRFVIDNALAKIAIKNGADVLTATRVTEINFEQNIFSVKTNTEKNFTTKLVIGSYGKRDLLDKKLNRSFIKKHTGYMGVKYHVKTDYPLNEVGLDNFENGYCGIVKIEEDKYNICYLYQRQANYSFNTIGELEENVLFKNPVIKNIFSKSTFIHEQPEVINEISFAPKKLIENHIIMCGDTAGSIVPLCGNGMAMAIHAAKLLSELIISTRVLDASEISMQDRLLLEERYSKVWKTTFSSRLFWGRNLQSVFGNNSLTEISIRMLHGLPPVEQWLLSKTHGKKIDTASTF